MTSLELEIVVGRSARHAVLRMPTVGQTHVFVANPSLQRAPENEALADSLQITDIIDTVDGEPPSMELARMIAGEPAARNAVMQARAQWLAAWRDRGVARLQCPHCRRGERAVTLDALASALHVARRQLVDTTGRLLPFCLSFPPSPSRAAGVAARLPFRLPSSVAAASIAEGAAADGVLVPINPELEARAWQRFAPIGRDPVDEDRDDWTFESAGFRAVLRAGCALESLGSRSQADLTPADIEPRPLGDLCFLDELYALAFLTPATPRTAVPCPDCGQSLLVQIAR